MGRPSNPSEEEFFAPGNFPKDAKVLDVGCGPRKKIPWAVGLDRVKTPDADVVHDINVYPWPFKDGTFDAVIASHVVEHVPDIVRWCQEVHRICKDGALIHVACPHHSNPNAFMDPTHVHFLGYRSFDYFVRPEDTHLPLLQRWVNRVTAKGSAIVGWYTEPLFEIAERHITFLPPWKWLGLPLFTRHLPFLYEYILSGVFIAQNLLFLLRVKKGRPPA